MTTERLNTLLSLYKKAIKNQLSLEELDAHILITAKELDRSFVEKNAEDIDIKLYINELYELKTNLNNE